MCLHELRRHGVALIFAVAILGFGFAHGQVVVLTPYPPSLDDSLDIVFDANLGNGALAAFAGPVYAHCGLITPASTSLSDWKFVVGNWGTADARVRMTPLGGGRHRLRVLPRAFYGLPMGAVDIRSYAFVFRNANGSIVGRSSTGGDIFVNVPPSVPTRSVQSHQLVQGRLRVFTKTELFTFQLHGDSAVRAYYHPTQVEQFDSNYVVVQPANTSPSFAETDSTLELSSTGIRVRVTKSPFTVRYFSGATLLTRESFGFTPPSGGRVAVGLALRPGETLQGGGSRTMPVNRRGLSLDMYNTAIFGYQQDNALNLCVPFFVSSAGYGVLFDNWQPAQADLGASFADALLYTADGGRMGYYIVAGGSPAGVLKQYTALTGRQPMPPRWAMGYLQSRYGYETETETRSIASQLRAAGFPLDGLFLDLYWFGSPGTMGNLNWDNARFPQPTQMMTDLRNQGVHTLLITEPYFTLSSTNYSFLNSNNLLARNAGGTSYVINGFWAGASSLIDVFRPTADAWWWPFYRARANEGVAAWWSDLGEPEDHPTGMVHHNGASARSVHNLYSFVWARMLWNGYRAEYPNTRLFNVIRSGWAGMQRFGTFPWSGDVDRSFGALQRQVPLMIGAGMSGIAYMHTNVGGFTGGGQNPELYARWHQLGAFSPIDWCHSNISVLPEPIYWDTTTQRRVRDVLRLRQRMIPYNYSLAAENALTGTPLIRPMDYVAPGQAELAALNDQYYWGPDLVVAPVLQAGQTTRAVRLPEGVWKDFFTGQRWAGGSSIMAFAPLDRIPVFARAGALIALSPYRPALSTYTADSLTIRFFADAAVSSSSASVYHDDGLSFSSLAGGQHERLRLEASHTGQVVTVNLARTGGFAGAPSSRRMEFELPDQPFAPQAVTWAGLSVPSTADAAAYRSTMGTAWFYDATRRTLWVKAPWNHSATALVITYPMPTSVEGGVAADRGHAQLHPNPARDVVTLRLDDAAVGRYRLHLVDAKGQTAWTGERQHDSPGPAEWLIGLPSNVSAGAYSMWVEGPGLSHLLRLVVAR